MKRLLHPLMILMLTACQPEAELPEATSAAKEVYMQYADRKDLTVAIIGDYQGYNAVMLQAQDADGWLQLCEEFGVNEQVDVAMLDSTKVSSLKTMSFTDDTVSFFGNPDSMQLPGLYGEFFSNMIDSMMSSGTCHKYLDTAYTITRHEKWVNGHLVDKSRDTATGNDARKLICSDDRLLHTAHEHGNCGYLVRGDSKSLSLWLFFYSNKEELSQIINNITIKHQQQ